MKAEGQLTWSRLVLTVALFAVVVLALAVLALGFGTADVSVSEALRGLFDPAARNTVAYEVLIQQRLPRIVLGILVGFSLGVAGVAFQAMLRNPLAEPYTLGVASGAAVGAVLALSFNLGLALGPFTSVQAAALLGALAIMLLIYRLGLHGREFRVESLLLAGVTVALVTSSVVIVIRTLSDPLHLVTIDRWLLGGLAVIGSREITSFLPLLLPGLVVLFQLAGPFNQLVLGEELAFGRGVDPAVVQKWGFFAGSLVTAAAVSVAGPIGFVGLIVPHAVRRLVGPDHRLLLPCAGLAAAGFLVLCDTIARTVVAPTELPVGVVTATVGGPVFVIMLWRQSRRRPG